MNVVKKYVLIILFQSVLFTCAYDSSSVFDSNARTKQLNFRPMSSSLSDNDLKTQTKLKTSNEVVYNTQSTFENYEPYISHTVSIKEEASQIDINLKYETSSTSTDYPKNSDITFDSTYSSDFDALRERNETTTPEYEIVNNETVSSTIEHFLTTTEINIPSTINICETAKITDVNITPYPFSLNITWKNNIKTEYCKFSFIIKLAEEEKIIITNNSFIYINYLNACKLYKGIILTIYNENEIDNIKFNGTTSAEIDPVEQISNFVNNGSLRIYWSPTQRTSYCIRYYVWKYFQDENLIDVQIVDSTYIVIWDLNGCLNNTFSVSAAINDSYISSPQYTTFIDIRVNGPPIFLTANTSANSAVTTWKFGKICKPESFLVNFTSDNELRTVEGTFDLENNTLTAEIYNLNAYTNYSCQGAIKNEVGSSDWSERSPDFQTKEKEPDMPENLTITQLINHNLHISWEAPYRWNGKEESYTLIIEFLNINYTQNNDCSIIQHDPVIRNLDSGTNFFNFENAEPASTYKISVSAQSSGGSGKFIDKVFITTEAVPDKPKEILHHFQKYSLKNIYNVSLYVEWNTPCQIRGNINYYAVELFKCNNNNINKKYIIPASPSRKKYEHTFMNLLPDSCYNFIVKLYLQTKYNEEQVSFLSPAGIPDIAETVNIPIPNATVDDPETTANVYIENNIFTATMGEILYYAIIVAEAGCEENPLSGVYLNWTEITENEMCNNESKAYQATGFKWNPFKQERKDDSDLKVYILGTEKICTTSFCNKPLIPNTNYSIKIRGFTKNGFSDTQLIYFSTASFLEGFQLALIIGLIVGILAIAFVIAAALFYTRGKLNFKGWPRMESNSNISPAPLPVPFKKFRSHYAKMIENSGKIKNEFQLLSTISSDVTLSTKTAMLPINRKKNRYINILPYDQTRVKLIDPSITAADYINASYIKGYNDNLEYIATQGPTESTCAGFWQMIMEQNVYLIVMLTQFIESGKDKCYKYFPDLHETHDYLNTISIKCTEEILKPNYNKRSFKIQMRKEKKTVIHLQFNMWPDFGVPQDLHHIIGFCKIMKEIKGKKSYLTVMHCSAGVGRTGSLIAVDILMQTIRDKRKVDIFGTVLNLRRQRMNMVQSEVQYEFLYQCTNYLVANNSRNTNVQSKKPLDQINESQVSESNML